MALESLTRSSSRGVSEVIRCLDFYQLGCNFSGLLVLMTSKFALAWNGDMVRLSNILAEQ